MRLLATLVVMLTMLAGTAMAQPERIRRVGLLTPISSAAEFFRTFALPVLQQQGFAEGRNLTLEVILGPPEQMSALARDLVATNPDVIVAISSSPLVAASTVTNTIPIVAFGADPVSVGLATTFARPNRNVTGISIVSAELDAKRLQLLAEALPGVRRMTALVLPSLPTAQESQRLLREAAAVIGVSLSIIAADKPEAYAPAFAAIERSGSGAVVVMANPIFARDTEQIASLALTKRQPTICEWREMAERGCMLSYGPSRSGLYTRLGEYVGRILGGAQPADLPIEQPTAFELIVNQRIASQLGVQVPSSFLARADEVIE
jgi:putative ABC transport system substrate-binding protein